MSTPQKDLKSSTSNIFGNLRCQFIFKFLNFTLIFWITINDDKNTKNLCWRQFLQIPHTE